MQNNLCSLVRMREKVKEFVGICAEHLPITEPIYEFGSLQVEGQEGFGDLRPFFPNMRYVGTDMREGVGVDRVLDLHDIDLPDSCLGTILCMDTLEHVEYARRAVEEMYRVLKPEGILICSSAMQFYIHDHPYDYWRFTPEGLRSLLQPFSRSYIDYSGKMRFPRVVVGIGYKSRPDSDLTQIDRCFENITKNTNLIKIKKKKK